MSEEAIYLPPSPDWDYITLKWAGNNLDGSVVVGTIEVSFDGTGPFLDDHETLPISVFKKTIVSNIVSRTFVIGEDSFTVGYAELKVPVSNDPDVTGSDATYTFNENFTGGRKNVTFVADASTPGGVIWLNKIAPTTPNPGNPVPIIYYSDFVELMDRVETLESGGVPPGDIAQAVEDYLTQNPPAGGSGEDGREVQLQTNATHIQWRYEGDSTWTDLIALSALEGAPGADGTDGTDGAAGADGPAIELQTSATHIQWRVVGDSTWIDLIALASLQGESGADGSPGDPTQVADGAIPQIKVSDSSGWITEALADKANNEAVSNLVTYTTSWPARPDLPWPITFVGPLAQQGSIADLRAGDLFVSND